MEPENKSLEIWKVHLETIIFRFHVKFRGCTPSESYDFEAKYFSLDGDLPFRDDFEAV